MGRRKQVPVGRQHLARSALAVALAISAAGARAAVPASEADADANANADVYDPFIAFAAAETANTPEAPYRDRLIDPTRLAPTGDEDDGLARSSDGPPRALHLDVVAQNSRLGGLETTEFGLGFGGFRDTVDWGTFSLEALLFREDDPRRDSGLRGTASLWQRGLDMPGGWRVDNGLGVLGTPMPQLLREQYRFVLPGVSLLGATSEWRDHEAGASLHAALGRGGVSSGTRLSGFDTGEGHVYSAGAQWRQGAAWTGAAMALVTDDRVVPDNQGVPAFQNAATRALLLGQRWQAAAHTVDLRALASDGGRDAALGAWADVRSAHGDAVHRYGLFHLPEALAWGAWPIANNARGGYYRIDYRRARWSWNLGLDRIEAITAGGFDGWYLNAALRHQQSPFLAWGGSVSGRRDGDGARAVATQSFVDMRWRLGDTRLQLDLAQESRSADSWQLQLDHALRLREGWRLSVATSVGELAAGGRRTGRSLGFAASGGIELGQRFGLDGSLRWSRNAGDADDRGFDIGLGWRWKLGRRWSLQGDVVQTTGSRRSPFLLDPLTGELVQERLPNDRSAQIRLRYETSAGRAAQVLGGRPGTATGRISGSVFLDDNADGVRGAAERPAPDLVVILDGRYVVRADGDGRFAFDQVAVGEHTLEIVADNLPLPWSLAPEQATRRVRVDVRREQAVDIPAQRPR